MDTDKYFFFLVIYLPDLFLFYSVAIYLHQTSSNTDKTTRHGVDSLIFPPAKTSGTGAPTQRLWKATFLIPFVTLVFSESSKEQFASTNIAEELVRLFQKQTEHEKKEMIFEVLAPLAENGNVTFLLFFFLVRVHTQS